MTDKPTMEERKEMAFVGMDVRLFLQRMAATHFDHPKDHEVLKKLAELADQWGADQWGAGVDIWKQK